MLEVVASLDSYMNSDNPDTNYEPGQVIHFGPVFLGGGKDLRQRPIGNFNVSALAGSAVNSAKLRRYTWGITNGGFAATIYRCKQPDTWVESEVTWNDYKLNAAWLAPGGDVDNIIPTPVGYIEATTVGFHEITGLKGLVEDAVANRSNIVSLIIVADDENPGVTHEVNWYDRLLAITARRWRLVIDFASPDPGRRGGQRSRFGAGALTARPASPTSGAAPHRPHAAR